MIPSSPADSLFPRQRNPYVIVAPPFNRMSAGVKVLHTLCHSLNMAGERAYIAIYPQLFFDAVPDRHLCPDLCTPLISRGVLDEYEKRGRSPIVIYSEGIEGNPLNAQHVVRYYLNYADYFDSPRSSGVQEHQFFYSRRIAEQFKGREDQVLFMPVSDPTQFVLPPPEVVRQGSCFYAAKYKDFHGGPLLPITDSSLEITRHKSTSQSKDDIIKILQSSELLYTYEDTALAIEAALCGCPTVFIPNKFLEHPLGFDDVGMDGFAWGISDAEIARAKATVHNFRSNYETLIGRYWSQLETFISYTQEISEAMPASPRRIKLLSEQPSHTFKYLLRYAQRYGFSRFGKKVLSYLKK